MAIVVVAIVDDELTIERLRLAHGRVRLVAENTGYPDIVVPELAELYILGDPRRCLHHA